MNRFAALTAAALVALGCYAVEARADANGPAAPPVPAPGGCMPGGPRGVHPWMDRGGPMGMMGHGPGDHDDGEMGLFAPSGNKNLSEADVKTIAQAMLLEHGNHSWAVANVSTAADKTIGFSFVTAHGDTVASFSLDPATGRVQRVN